MRSYTMPAACTRINEAKEKTKSEPYPSTREQAISTLLKRRAMGFVPSPTSYQHHEAPKITGIRKSLIVNYFTADWRATEKLAFPDQPVRLAA